MMMVGINHHIQDDVGTIANPTVFITRNLKNSQSCFCCATDHILDVGGDDHYFSLIQTQH